MTMQKNGSKDIKGHKHGWMKSKPKPVKEQAVKVAPSKPVLPVEQIKEEQKKSQ